MFQEWFYQRSKPEEEELQQFRGKYHDKQQKMMIDSSANELNASQETSDKQFKIQEDSLMQMREDLKEKINHVLIRTHSK